MVTSDSRGREARSPRHMPPAAWKDIFARSVTETWQDNVGLVAAGVAFYGFLALVPLLAAIVLIYGLVAEPMTVVDHMRQLMRVLPHDIAVTVARQLLEVVTTSGGKKGAGLVVALGFSLYGASNGAGAIMTALNIAYEEREKRSLLRFYATALVITAGAIFLALAGFVATTVLSFLEDLLPRAGAALLLGRIAAYLLLVLGAAAVAATLYRYGPSRERARWEWITPGSLFAAFGWMLLTLLFGFYVGQVANFSATYGSLATVAGLLTWMYLSAYVFLFGAELNSELEHQTAQDSTEGPPQPLGQRGAWAADHVAGWDDCRAEADKFEPIAGMSAAQPGGAGKQPQKAAGRIPMRPYVASRAAAWAAGMAGLPRIGAIGSGLATLGLAMLGRRGRERTGAALLATAAGLSLLRRIREKPTPRATASARQPGGSAPPEASRTRAPRSGGSARG